MSSDDRIFTHRMPLAAMSFVLALSLGLAGCDQQKPAQQAERDAGRVGAIDQGPSTTAGKPMEEPKGVEMDSVAKFSQAAGDVELNLKVQSAINENPELKRLPIIVQTDAGVVTLSGTADSPDKRLQAEKLAMSVNGVKAVDNKLSVGTL
jgi:osmotically-inducible protein OsmY